MNRNLGNCLGAAALASLLCAGSIAFGPAASATVGPAAVHLVYDIQDQATRRAEVKFADTHWNWTAWNDPTPVRAGQYQDNFECAELVARALSAAGLVPGLGPDAPQDDYLHYRAPNGRVYDLLLITPQEGYHTLYEYMMDSGIGKDVGNAPNLAQPGDVFVTFLGPGGAASHTGLVVSAATPFGQAAVDAHNKARYHSPYPSYAPSHLVELTHDAALRVRLWAAAGDGTAHSEPEPARPPQPASLVLGRRHLLMG